MHFLLYINHIRVPIAQFFFNSSMKRRAFKWWNCLEINSFGTVFRIYFVPRKCKIAHISSLVPFWPCKMTSRRVESSDVAGVTRACSNLQILFTSIPQFAAAEFFCLLQEKMPNRCVVAGCSNVPDLSKNIYWSSKIS